MNGQFVGVTETVSGWAAYLYDRNGPIQTGYGRYATEEGAKQEARDWAAAHGIYTDFDQRYNLELASKR